MKNVTHYALVCMLTITCAVLAGGCKNNNSQASRQEAAGCQGVSGRGDPGRI